MKLYNIYFVLVLSILGSYSLAKVTPEALNWSAVLADLDDIKDKLSKLAADPKIQDYKDHALASAVLGGYDQFTNKNKAAIDYLISQGANINSRLEDDDLLPPALHRAAGMPNKARLAYLLALPNIDINIEKNKQNAFSLAIREALSGDEKFTPIFIEMARMLLDKGATAQILNAQGNAPLHEALLQIGLRPAAKTIAHFLIKSSDSINTQNAAGKTPLHLAVEKQQHNMFDSLMARKADTTLQDIEGYTPLHKAITRNDKYLINILLKHNPPVNAQNYLGNTPLHLAVLYQNLDLVKRLINLGADLSIKDKNNRTPLEQALAALDQVAVGKSPEELKTNADYIILQQIADVLQAGKTGQPPAPTVQPTAPQEPESLGILTNQLTALRTA